jgi:hypothetical protein
MATFEVFVDDNFHYMDKSMRYSAGTFETYEEAVALAKAIVDDYLEPRAHSGITANALFTSYRQYGEDPFIAGDLGEDVLAETLTRMISIIAELEARRESHGDSFQEMNKPLNLPVGKVRFSAWDYAEARCKELCR